MSVTRILCVDDSPADLTSLQIAFEQSGLPISLTLAEGGRAALAHLKGVEARADRRLPHLMLVDVQMPGFSGLQLLARIKSDDRLRGIPVWMLSSSDDRRHVRAAYHGWASGYLRKPRDFEALRRQTEWLGRLCAEALAFDTDD